MGFDQVIEKHVQVASLYARPLFISQFVCALGKAFRLAHVYLIVLINCNI